jgi:hypothetical protein
MAVLVPSERSGDHPRIGVCALLASLRCTDAAFSVRNQDNNRLASAFEKRAKLRTGSPKSCRMRRGDVAEWLKAAVC